MSPTEEAHRRVGFESFRRQEERRPARRRLLSFAFAAIFHAGLIAAALAYSYWHIDELTLPAVRVTFISMTPPPPPPPPPPIPAGGRAADQKAAGPPPPPAGRAGARKSTIKPKGLVPVAPPPAEIVQPPADPKPVQDELVTHAEPNDGGDEDAAATPTAAAGTGKAVIGTHGLGEGNGVKGGAKGGTISGVGAPQGPQSVSAQVGGLQKKSGDMPDFPDSLIRGNKLYAVETKICVSTSGAVDSVTLTKRSDMLLDANVLSTVATWRYRPMTVNNAPVAFCYPVRFEFRSER
jgi:outer membrane biosynthesis protein TonB